MKCGYQAKLESLKAEAEAILAVAGDQRTEAQKLRAKAIPAEVTAVKAEKAENDALLALKTDLDLMSTKPTPGQNLHNNAGHPAVKANHSEITALTSADEKKARTGGFKSIGHFCHSLAMTSTTGGRTPDLTATKAMADWTGLSARLDLAGEDEEARVQAFRTHEAWKAGQGLSLSDPSADVFVPMEFSSEIFKRKESLDSDIESRCSKMTIRGTSIRIPCWNDSNRGVTYRAGGVRAFWEDEGDAATASKINKTRLKDFRLNRLTAAVYATDELLADSPMALDSYINQNASIAISFMSNQAIWEGSGVGKPKGMSKSNAFLVINKESSQAAATILAANVDKMFMRFYAGNRSAAVWHINQDCEQALSTLFYATGANSGQLLYMPPTGLSGQGYSTMKGRPVLPLEFCETLGTQGDIVLVDWSQYMVVSKGGANSERPAQGGSIIRDVSMHVAFLSHEQVFRFTRRLDGDCMWDAPLTPLKGSTTTSCAVALQTRS